MRLSRSRAPAEERYLRAVVPGPSLEGNPLGSPAQRELHVYLPPGYHQDPTRRYPVLYFLHGWGAADLGELAARTRGALAGVRLLVNCAEDDEFGLAGPCRRFAKRLGGLGLDCNLEIYAARGLNRLSPHAVGIAGRILPAIRFCLRNLAADPDWATAAQNWQD